MKLRRLYSSQPSLFSPIGFNDGLSAIVAEIRLPENRGRDTHNLGKTTVGQLIDFCLLKGKDRSFFLFKHENLFIGFTFFLEIQIEGSGYLTIGRRVQPGTKVEFKRTFRPLDDANKLVESDWDHYDVAFDRALDLLDGYLAIESLRPWRFRKLAGYLIRSQQDYLQVFQLGKFSGPHRDWKPFVAFLLGLPAKPAIDLYDTRAALETTAEQLKTLTEEWSGGEADPSMLDGLIAVKRREVEERGAALDTFDFQESDHQVTEEVVDQLEAEIVSLNEESYQLAQLTRQITVSLESRTIAFKPAAAAKLFKEAGILFGEQLTKDFDQLIAFNRAIAEERRGALEVQLTEVEQRQGVIADSLKELNRRRARSLEYLRESDALAKFRELSRQMSTLNGEVSTLEARRAAAARLLELRQQRRSQTEAFNRAQSAVETALVAISADETSLFARIRRHYTEIIRSVLGADAIIGMGLNAEGGIDFKAEFVGASGVATSGDRGTSYRKLLCIAFDLAVLRAHLDVPFPRVVFLDGAFEGLDRRKQTKLLGVFREYAALGLQPIITLLDSDAPSGDSDVQPLTDDDVVLTLHDEGDDGLLFHLPSW